MNSQSIVIAGDAIWLITVVNYDDPVYHHYAVATDGERALMYTSERDKLTTKQTHVLKMDLLCMTILKVT